MSEQTPGTGNGVADGQDPSMEDILASIRKIIAEDDSQAGGQADTLLLNDPFEDVQADAEKGDVANLTRAETLTEIPEETTLDLDILADDESAVDLDINALLGDQGETSQNAAPLFNAAPSEAVETTLDAADDVDLDDILSLEIPMDDSEDIVLTESIALDETVDLAIGMPEDEAPKGDFVDGALAALGLGGAAVAAKAASTEAIQPPEDDLSLMLDNMLEDSGAYDEESAEAEQVFDPAADLLADIQDEDIVEVAQDSTEQLELSSNEADPDMDLVKSLMADLTEEPLHEDQASAAETEGETALEAIDTDDAESSDDVMDEILSMTLDDEAKLSEEIAIAETPSEPEVSAEAPPEPMSLKDIAAAAAEDAKSAESNLGAGLAAAAGIGVVGAALATHEDEQDEAEADIDVPDVAQPEDIAPEDIDEPEAIAAEPTSDPIETLTPENNLEETTPMARAKKSDAIIDDVTEEATIGAFASLTSVVEEKATVAERGDRIGDLVQEALRPMLKEWLDKNLKGIVERAVTKEVKRISSGK